MSKKLEQFVKDNRDEFDNFEPGPVVWHNIQQQLKKAPEKKGILISMKVLRWSAAAAVIVAIGSGTYLFMQSRKQEPIAVTPVKVKTSPAAKNTTPLAAQQDVTQQTPETSKIPAPNKYKNGNAYANNQNEEYSEELYHYTRLIELKQNEIIKIKKDEPLLYQKFAGDINRLDSTFHTLKKELPVNPNREQILEAMIRNLQLQEALLNQQLTVIKKINHTKKAEYEKAFKSI